MTEGTEMDDDEDSEYFEAADAVWEVLHQIVRPIAEPYERLAAQAGWVPWTGVTAEHARRVVKAIEAAGWQLCRPDEANLNGVKVALTQDPWWDTDEGTQMPWWPDPYRVLSS